MMKEAIKKEDELELTGYLVRDRGYGQGDVRINTFLELSEDIYSLGFATQLKDDVLTKYFDVLKGELINLRDSDDSSDSSSEDEKEKKGSQIELTVNGGKSNEVEVDVYTKELEE